MTFQYRFYKDELGWFIDIKYFPFSRAWLAMIQGADELLDLLSEGNNEVWLEFSRSTFDNHDGILHRMHRLGLTKGAVYRSDSHTVQNTIFEKDQLWLCPATLWIFFNYPKRIYYKVISAPTTHRYMIAPQL